MNRTVTVGGNPFNLKGQAMAEGSTAPDFKALNPDMSPFDFYEATKGKVKLISVAHSVDTGICSLQTIRFNQEAGEMKDKAAVITVTADLPFALKRFCAAEGIENSYVVSDYRHLAFGEAYGFAIDELRLLARGIVVVDQDNRVRYAEYCPEVGMHPDYDKALEIAKGLLD